MTTTKPTARRPAASIEEKKAQAAALHESIATQVERLRDSDAWTRFLDFAQAFHAYSFNNLVLILTQCPEASQVAGFRKWQGLNRQVRKGETGIRIFGFGTKKITEEDEDGDEVEKRLKRFPILSVFDVSQTDLIDPEQGDPGHLAHDLTGTNDHGVIAALTGYLEGEGWSVTRQNLGGQKKGYTEPQARAVVVCDSLTLEQAAKTFIHEAAHVILGHTDDYAEYVEHRGLMETEAESVAYVVAGLVGFDTAAYSVGYIAGWSGADVELIKGTASRVLRAAHQVAEILDPAEDDSAAQKPGGGAARGRPTLPLPPPAGEGDTHAHHLRPPRAPRPGRAPGRVRRRRLTAHPGRSASPGPTRRLEPSESARRSHQPRPRARWFRLAARRPGEGPAPRNTPRRCAPAEPAQAPALSGRAVVVP